MNLTDQFSPKSFDSSASKSIHLHSNEKQYEQSPIQIKQEVSAFEDEIFITQSTGDHTPYGPLKKQAGEKLFKA